MDDAALASHLHGLLAYGDSKSATAGVASSVLAGQQVLFA
jgi:hypothetical protein